MVAADMYEEARCRNAIKSAKAGLGTGIYNEKERPSTTGDQARTISLAVRSEPVCRVGRPR